MLTCRLAAPLTDEQKFELEVERKLLNEWTLSKRKIYRANQELVRIDFWSLPFLALQSRWFLIGSFFLCSDWPSWLLGFLLNEPQSCYARLKRILIDYYGKKKGYKYSKNQARTMIEARVVPGVEVVKWSAILKSAIGAADWKKKTKERLGRVA